MSGNPNVNEIDIMRFWRGKALDDLLDKFSISSKKGLFFFLDRASKQLLSVRRTFSSINTLRPLRNKVMQGWNTRLVKI